MIKAYVDASVKPQTSIAGLGVLLIVEGQQHPHKFRVEGVKDNHMAEFFAFRNCLRLLKDGGWERDLIQVFSDSKLLVDSVTKSYAGQEDYAQVLRMLLKDLQAFPNLYLQWIPQKQNQGADQLARQALKE